MSLTNVEAVRLTYHDDQPPTVEVMAEDGTTVDADVVEYFKKYSVTDKGEVSAAQVNGYKDLKAGTLAAADFVRGENPGRGESFDPPGRGRP